MASAGGGNRNIGFGNSELQAFLRFRWDSWGSGVLVSAEQVGQFANGVRIVWMRILLFVAVQKICKPFRQSIKIF